MPEPQPLSDADRADLTAYLDGELAGEERRRVEARLATDPQLRSEADSLKRAWELLDALPRPAPSNEFTTRTLDRVSALRVATPSTSKTEALPAPKRPWLRRSYLAPAAWAAVAAVALGIGYAITPGPRPVTAAAMNPDTDPLMKREPSVIENLSLYLAAENLDFLLALDQSDLFADDGSGR